MPLPVAFFGQGVVGLGWRFISDVAPKKLMGLAWPVLFQLGRYRTPLMIGMLSYVFIVGDVHRIELD